MAWSWPGVWLKSTYQLVDNSVVGANRAGFHVKYDHNSKYLEMHASYGEITGEQPHTRNRGECIPSGLRRRLLPLQQNGFAMIGHDRQLGLYVAWHLPSDDDVVFDGVEDYLNRDADAGQPLDVVDTRSPLVVLSWATTLAASTLRGRRLRPLRNDWKMGDYTRRRNLRRWLRRRPARDGERTRRGPLVEGRRYALTGLPSIPYGPPPTMRGTAFIVDQKIGL